MLQLSLGQKDTLQNHLTKTLIPITSEGGGGVEGSKNMFSDVLESRRKRLIQKYL